jgi:hypothetical protein
MKSLTYTTTAQEPASNIGNVCEAHAPRGGGFVGQDPTSFVGKYVKMNFVGKTDGGVSRNEHMWVLVLCLEGGLLTGTLNNDPIYDHGGLKDGSIVKGITVAQIEEVYD